MPGCTKLFKPAILSSSSQEVQVGIFNIVLRVNTFVDSSLADRPLLNPIRSGDATTVGQLSNNYC